MSACAALAACSSGSRGAVGGTSSAPQSGGNLVVARAADITSLVPSIPTDNASIWVLEEIYSTLVVPSQDGKSLKPDLAKSWKQSADKLSWTFHLRPDARFSDGKPVTSADVKFSIEQVMKPSSPNAFIDTAVSKVDTPDAHTVVIHTKTPWAALPADMGMYPNSIVPKGYGGKTQNEFSAHPIGSGPFKLDSWAKGSSLKLSKNPRYWDKKRPYVDRVTFTVVPDGNTRSTQLSSGQAQIDEYPPYSSAKALKANPTLHLSAFPSSEVDYLAINNDHKPFGDIHVRKAISQAINRKALLKAALYGYGSLANAYLSPATWAHNAGLEGPTYDVHAAKVSLAKSSVPRGFSTTISIASGDQVQATEAQLVQSDLGKVGIKVRIKTMDPAALVSAQEDQTYDMRFARYTTDIVDPSEIAAFAGVYSDAKTLWTGFKSAKMETLVNQANRVTDQKQRKGYYDQMQAIIAKNVPYVTLYYAPALYAYTTKVHGFHPSATGNYTLEDVWLSK